MAKAQRGSRAPTGTAERQAPRGSATIARDGGDHSSDAWLAAVVFGSPEAKVPVNIRLDADIVRYFRAGGPGYQTRINDVLKAFVQARLRAGDSPGPRPKGRTNGRKGPK